MQNDLGDRTRRNIIGGVVAAVIAGAAAVGFIIAKNAFKGAPLPNADILRKWFAGGAVVGGVSSIGFGGAMYDSAIAPITGETLKKTAETMTIKEIIEQEKAVIGGRKPPVTEGFVDKEIKRRTESAQLSQHNQL